MGVSRLVVVWSILSFGFFHIYKTQYGSSSAMTWMWETPRYQHIDLPAVDTKYKLYFYGEGSYFWTETNRAAEQGKWTFSNSRPVLYIPGSGGSYKQGRSIGSVLYKKMQRNEREKKVFNFHFNTFTLDLNEELTGIYGGTLQSQTEFVAAAIRQILSFYPSGEQIFIVGHSMGGIVARSVMAQKLIEPGRVAFLVTLGSPHQAPVIPDPSLVNFTKHTRKEEVVDKVNCVSVSGGLRDIQVRPALSHTGHCLNVRGEAVPLTWTSQDHQSLVWDNGLTLATARTFYDFGHSPADGPEIVKYHWFNKFSSRNNFQSAQQNLAHLREKMRNQEWSSVNLSSEEPFKKLKFGFYRVQCDLEGTLRVISKGDMSHILQIQGRYQPSIQLPDGYFMTEVESKIGTELELYVGQMTATAAVTTSVQAPVPYVMSWFVSIFPYFQYRYPIQSPSGVSVVNLTGLAITYQMIDASVDGDGLVIFQEDGVKSIVGKGQVSLSLTRGREEPWPQLVVIGSDVTTLTLRVNFPGVIDILLREYWSVLLCFMVVNMIFITASNIRGKRPTRVFWDVLEAVGKPYYICPVLSITHGAFHRSWLESIVPGKDSIFEPDSEKLDDRNLYFSTIYIMSFIVAVVLLATISRILFWSMWCISYLLGRSAGWINWLTSRKSFIVPLCAILLNYNGTVALLPVLISQLFYLLVLIRTGPNPITTPMSLFWIYFLKFQWVLLAAALMLPSTIFWIKNGDLGSQLPTDPSFMPAFFTIVAFSSDLISKDLTIPRMKILLFLSMMVGLFCSVNIHRVVFVIPITIGLINTKSDLFPAPSTVPK